MLIFLADSSKVTIAYVIQGASQWSTLEPLIAHIGTSQRQLIIASDMIQTNTAQRTLLAVNQSHFRLEGAGADQDVPVLASAELRRSRLTKWLRRSTLNSANSSDKEASEILIADLGSMPDMDLYLSN